MKDDLEAKTLEALKERKQQLTHQINVMDQMRVRQIDTAVNAAGDAARELTSERRIAIHANINPYFLPALDDLHNQLAAVQSRIYRLGQNQNGI
jgi:hypothetical protein